MEFLITFVLIFTVFASTDSKRTDLGGSTPLTVGLSVGVCHLWAVSITVENHTDYPALYQRLY